MDRTLSVAGSVALLERLVGFDTTSRDSNLDLIGFVRDWLAGHGVTSELVHDATGTKASLWATIGPTDRGGIVLSGHTDVVPVDGQDWHTDPFRLTERDGLLYGRGTCDMKGFIACVLAAVPTLVARGPVEPVHIALSYDEEVGCLGVRPLLQHVIASHPRPRLCIVGEPTSMDVVDSHKGIRSFETIVTGREAHSSRPDKGVNAIVVMAGLVGFLQDLAAEMVARGDPSGRFEPAATTVGIGVIDGGSATNIVARRCRLQWEYRSLPTSDADEIERRFRAHVEDVVLPDMRARAPEEAAVLTRIISEAPPLFARAGSEAEALVKRLAQRNETKAVAYVTEAGLFDQNEIPTIVCGPGDIAQAHRPDEFIPLEQMAACDAFLARLADVVCAP